MAEPLFPDYQKSWTAAVDAGMIGGDAEYYYTGAAGEHEYYHALLVAILEAHGVDWNPAEPDPDPGPDPKPPSTDGPNPADYTNIVTIPPGTHNGFSRQVQANTLYVGDGAILDGQNQTVYAFYGTASNVGITGFEIRNYKNPDQRGAIDTTGANEWFVHGCDIHHNYGAGVALDGNRHLVRGNHIHHQGQIGIKIRDGEGSRVENNRFVDNKQRPEVNWGWEGGGSKFARNRNLTIANNYWTDKGGPGCWVDIANEDITIVGNTMENCLAAGIFYEISRNAVIKDNVVRNCGHGRTSWWWGAGILLSSSYGVHVEGNLVEDCEQGIMSIYQPRGTGREARDITVVGNRVVNSGRSGATDNQSMSATHPWYESIDFAHNEYVDGAGFRWASSSLDKAGWRQIHPEDAV